MNVSVFYDRVFFLLAFCIYIDECIFSNLCNSLTIVHRTIGPVSSGLGEGLADRDVLVPSSSSDSCGGPDAMHDRQVYGGCFLRHIGAAGFWFKRAL